VSWLRCFIADDEPGAPPPSAAAQILNLALVLLATALIFCFAFHRVDYRWNWAAIWKYRAMFLQGWLATLWISLAALAASTLLGLILAFARRSPFLPLQAFARLYIEIIRGTPLLVQILIFFYMVANAFGVQNRYLVGVLVLAGFSAAYIAEIIRAGIESVGRSQLESARAIGLTRAQTYWHVVFPQALRQTMPPLAGQFVSLIKDSSLLCIISINEFTQNAREVNSFTFSTLESYLPLAAGYLLLTLPVSWLTRRLERRHHYET
jgi:polar amino acid transport system permease protein